MSSQYTINSALMSDSDDERYEQELVKRRREAEARLWEEEEQQRAERRARKEARAAEKKGQEEELQRQMEVDSSEPKPSDVGVVVEKEGLHLSSLLTLLNELECLQEHDNQYVSRETKTLFGGFKDVL